MACDMAMVGPRRPIHLGAQGSLPALGCVTLNSFDSVPKLRVAGVGAPVGGARAQRHRIRPCKAPLWLLVDPCPLLAAGQDASGGRAAAGGPLALLAHSLHTGVLLVLPVCGSPLTHGSTIHAPPPLQDLSMALLSSRSAGRMPLPLAALVLAALFPRAQAITAADVLAFRATDGCISVEHTISFKVPDFVFPNIPEIVRMADVHLPAVVASAGAPAPGAGTCPMRSALPLPPANLLGSAVCAPIPSLQKDAAVAACRSYGEFWQLAGFNNKPYNLDVRNTRVDYQVTCYRCGLEDCAMLWFDNEAQCAGTCPSGWTPVTVPMRSGPMIPQGQGNPVLNDPHFGSPCSGGPGKVLCSLCGRIECADCRYAW